MVQSETRRLSSPRVREHNHMPVGRSVPAHALIFLPISVNCSGTDTVTPRRFAESCFECRDRHGRTLLLPRKPNLRFFKLSSDDVNSPEQ